MDSLPIELITHIFKFLSVYERRRLSVLNSTCCYASLDPMLLNEETFVIRINLLGFVVCQCYYPQYDIDYFEELILNSKRKIFSFKIIGLDYNLRILTIIKKLSNQIISLHLCDFTMTNLVVNFITSCDNLKTLKLENIKFLAISVETSKPLLKLKSLIFIDRQNYHIDNYTILFCAPNLVDLKFIGKDYSFESQLLINYLNNAKNINSIEMATFKAFICLPEHIKLRALVISSLIELFGYEYKMFISILSKQILLEKLILLNLPCCLLVAISKLHNLKHLELLVNQNSCISNGSCLKLFFNSIRNMKDITTLIIHLPYPRLSNLESCTIQDNILKSLTTLDCSIINCSKIVKFCKNLTNLTIRNNEVVTYSYSDLKLIIETLTNLTHLSIRMCLDEDILLRLPLSNIKGLISLKIMGCHITYRSLPCIQFACLEELAISCFSLTEDQKWEDVKDIWKEFGRSNPALIILDFTLRCPRDFYEPISTQIKRFINIKQLRPCFPKMNYFDFINNYLGIRGRRCILNCNN